MRISDWSSDVCSSDLDQNLRQEYQHAAETREDAVDQQALERAVRQALRGQRAERHDAGADAVHDRRRPREHGLEDQKQDRKSVVEGKGVSVRVDLGGSRNIKKKNNKNSTKKIK